MRKDSGLLGALRTTMSDGKWHTVRELFWAHRSLIRPEVAIRSWKAVFPDEDIPQAQQVEAGRRRVLVGALNTLGTEARGIRGSWDREYRLTDLVPDPRPSVADVVASLMTPVITDPRSAGPPPVGVAHLIHHIGRWASARAKWLDASGPRTPALREEFHETSAELAAAWTLYQSHQKETS